MKKTIALFIGILFLNTSFGQEIEMKVNLLGYKFVQNGERLNWKELIDATESNHEANLLIKKAKSHNTISTISLMVGGALIGIPLGQSSANVDPNWTLAYIGVGMATIGIPFSFSAFNKARSEEHTSELQSRENLV